MAKTNWQMDDTIMPADMNQIGEEINDLNESVEAATNAATANTLIKRDASGRAKVAAPSASDDIARKAEVDAAVTAAASDATTKANAVQSNLTTHTNNTTVHITAAERTNWNAKADKNGALQTNLNAELHNGTKRYLTFSELGLSAGTATEMEVFNAMASNSEFYISFGVPGTVKCVPPQAGYGLAIFRKFEGARRSAVAYSYAPDAIWDLTAGSTVVNSWRRRAHLDSPAFTGTPSAPTAVAGTNTTQLATTAFVNNTINSTVSRGAKTSGDFDTFIDPGTYSLSSNGGTWTNYTNAPTEAYPYGTLIVSRDTNRIVQMYIPYDNSSAMDRKGMWIRSSFNSPVAFSSWQLIYSSGNIKAILNNTELAGIPTAPTPSSTTNNNQLATTAFVQNLVKATPIPANTDLNTYSFGAEGSYYCPQNTTAATLLNCPVTEAFHLRVDRHAGIMQILTTYTTSVNQIKRYFRNLYSNTWTPWIPLPLSTGAVQKDLNTEMHGGWKRYSSLSELGLTNTSTIDDIFAAMPVNSILEYISPTQSAPLYLFTGSVIRFEKASSSRMYGRFTRGVTDQPQFYQCIYNNETTPKWSGWILSASTISPTFTGIPTVPTASAGTNTDQAASTAFVDRDFVKKTINLTAANTDLNTVVTSGFYRLQSGVVNGPSGINPDYCQLIVSRGSNTIGQILIVYTSGRTFVRGGSPPEVGGSGKWSDWLEVASTSFVQNAINTFKSTADNNYANAIVTGDTTIDPNTTTQSLILTNHSNGPGGGYYFIFTEFLSSRTGNRSQFAISYYSASPRMYIRTNYNGTWYAWRQLAPLDSPAFTGIPTAPTAAAGTNSDQLATTAFVEERINATAIPSGADLNAATYRTVQGAFFTPTSAIATSLANRPSNLPGSFNMYVYKTANNWITQLIRCHTLAEYRRYYNGDTGTWSNWTQIPTSNATQSASGWMLSSDKAKLDGIASGAQVNRSIATQAQAEAGTDNTTDMTPLRVAQAIAKLAPTPPVSSVAGRTGAIILTGTDVPAATTSARGTVQLSTATNSTSTTLAATASAVKAAYDRAEAAFQQANDGKAAIVASIIGRGGYATTGETFAQLAAKVDTLDRGNLSGFDWTPRSYTSTNVLSGWKSIAAGNGAVVAVRYQSSSGTSDQIVVSKDKGVTWSKVNLPGGTSDEGRQLTSIFFITDKFYVSTDNSWVYTSTDGTNWTRGTISGVGGLQGYSPRYGMAYGNDRIVSVGGPYPGTLQGFVFYNENPSNLLSWKSGLTISDGHFHDITFGKGLFVTVYQIKDSQGVVSTVIASSPNGVNWTSRLTLNITSVTANYFSSVSYGNGVFIAVRNGTNEAYISTNGTSWTKQSIPMSFYWSKILYSAGKFVLISNGNNGYLFLTDNGIKWRTISVGTRVRESITYDRDTFITLSDVGFIDTTY